jgi:fructose-bisphosphate aldolase class I
VIPGIKVDTGAHDQALFPGEKVTEGLDGLRARLEEYRELGARFAKWRAVITIGDGIPTVGCIRANAHALARYAGALSGGGHRADRRAGGPDGRRQHDRALFRRHVANLKWTFHELLVQRVDLRGALLKPNMVISGKGCPEQAPATRIAELTVDCFLTHVPAAVPGIVFLSGGQSEVEATGNLNAINRSAARGRSRSPTGARCSNRRWRRGPATRTTSIPRRRCSPTARG